MAEIIFRDLMKKAGRTDVSVSSCATSDEEILGGVGNPVYPPAREELEKHGLSAGNKRAVRLKKSDYGAYDLFVGMDGNNLRNMHRIFGGDPEGKIRKLLDFCGGGDVSDPWYSRRFDVAYGDILRGCKALSEQI